MYGIVFETVGDCVFDPVFKCVLCDDIQPVLILVCRNQMEQDGRYLYLFLINGMITAYLDLLTYPVAALGIPLVFSWQREMVTSLKRHTAFSLLSDELGVPNFLFQSRRLPPL